MWSKAKSIGGSVVKKAKSAGSFVAKKAKAGITAVKKGVKAISPKTLIANAKKMISGSAGKILPKVLKLPLIGPIIEGVFAAMEVKDIMANPELTAKDKQKQVGAIVGKSVGGLMGGAIASIGAQALNVAPGLGAVLTPVAYLGGDFLGRMAADALMNNVPNVDTMLGEATGKIFNLDYNQGSKTEETSKPEATAATTPKPQSTEESSPDDLVKMVDDVDSKSTPIPDNKTTISPDQVAASSSGAVALQSIPGSNLKTKTTPTVGKQTNTPTPKPGVSTIGKIASAAPTASVLTNGISPSGSASTSKKEYKPAADNSNTVSEQPDSENQTQTVNLEKNQQLQDIINILPKSGESLLSSVKTSSTPGKLTSDSTDEIKHNLETSEDGEESTESLSMLDKTKNLAKKVYPTSMIGRLGNKTKQIISKPKTSPGILTKGVGGLKNVGGKLKDKAYGKIDSMTPWYMPKASTMMGMTKSRLGRKGLAMAGGYAMNKAKDKIKDKIGTTKNLMTTKGKSLMSKGSTFAMKSSSVLKDKLGETMGSIGQPKKAVLGKPKSFLDNIKSGFKQSKLGKMFGFGASDSDNPQPRTGQSENNKPKSFLDNIKSGFKQSKLGKMFGFGASDSDKQSKTGSSLLGKIKTGAAGIGKKVQPAINSGKSFIQNQKSKLTNNNKSNYFTSSVDSLGTPGIESTPGSDKPNISSSSPSRDILSRAAPMSEKVQSTVLSDSAKLKERSRGKDKPNNSGNNNQSTNNNNSNTNNNDGGSSSTVISNSSNSTSTTTINKYDTDVVSRWRSGYIEDQHKPGHYSLYS